MIHHLIEINEGYRINRQLDSYAIIKILKIRKFFTPVSLNAVTNFKPWHNLEYRKYNS